MRKAILLEDSASLKSIFGPRDKNLQLLEDELGVSIHPTSRGISVEGRANKVEEALGRINKIVKLAKEGISLTRQDLLKIIYPQQSFDSSKTVNGKIAKKGIKVFSGRKPQVYPKTKGQLNYIEAITRHDIVIATGPAGTGKTYLAMAMAVNYLFDKKVRRIILTRPAIEAGESLGYLPGSMQEKLNPYLRPLYDALYDMMEIEVIEEYLETGIIEIAPLAYMRGRSLNNAFVILDEAQNCTSEQLRMFLTRLGFDSKTVITGDITQSDLPGGKPAGLLEAKNILKRIEGIKLMELQGEDVVRHPLIQKIIQAYENFYNNKV
ncbi:MAG: PhoH family protein [Candidatus Omnitrophica bacterium]|nr:PhoH family protein [Candidatus Omnitrophota bacterium]MCF7877907.1 PhoH family protein [Candidatus Omnitrophota bacterium]MCF7893083.1 PhoH family protein [Candidatus Omnitrophota bacterium]